MRVTVIATGFEQRHNAEEAKADNAGKPAAAADTSDIDDIFSIFNH